MIRKTESFFDTMLDVVKIRQRLAIRKAQQLIRDLEGGYVCISK